MKKACDVCEITLGAECGAGPEEALSEFAGCLPTGLFCVLIFAIIALWLTCDWAPIYG